MNESVRKWLDELVTTPSSAIQKLILGYSGVSAWSKCCLRECFIEICQTHSVQLDSALTGWLQDNLMNPPPQGMSMLVWASHLEELFGAFVYLPLPQVSGLLHDRTSDFRSWLHPLLQADVDPESCYLAALGKLNGRKIQSP